MDNNKRMLSASMMCADLLHIKETIRTFENAGIEYLHIDVMDGSFVPNFGLGTDYIRALRNMTDIPLDIHLMVDHPENKYDWLDIKAKDIVSVHYESTIHVQRALAILRQYGCKVFLAINPATPICFLEELVDYIDGINVLTVNPGFAGQPILPTSFKKTEKIRRMLDELQNDRIIMEVDGNISPTNAAIFSALGANMFVAGTSSVFSKSGSVEDNIQKIRTAISGSRP